MTVTPQAVQNAWSRLYGTPDGSHRPGADGYAREGLGTTGVPGMAIAVVFDDKPMFACCGTRDLALGDKAPIDLHSVFPLASLSKPITSTVMASLLTENLKEKSWYTPIDELDASYRAKTAVTVASLLAHRSGLVDHAGDLLEDLGFAREDILQRVTALETWPADAAVARYACPFAYTNFGYSEAAFGLAQKLKAQWEDLGAAFFQLYDMRRTSYRYADFLARDNAVKSYQRSQVPRADRDPLPPNPSWREPRKSRNPDAQSPAGGVTSSLYDLIEWMWLNIQAERPATQRGNRASLARGTGNLGNAHDNEAFYANIQKTHVAYPSPTDPAHYGFGWNTKLDAHMGLNLSHSGAFSLGAATSVSLLPRENIGIVVVTNGQPIGLPEAICRQFLYDVTSHPDRIPFAETLRGAATFMQRELYPVPAPDFGMPAVKPITPIKDASQFVGTYFNDYYQAVTISGAGSAADPFRMEAGVGRSFLLTPYEGLTFTFETTGENADGLSGVTFVPGTSGKISQLTVAHFKLPVRDGATNLLLKPAVFARQG